MTNPAMPERSPQIEELMRGLESAGFSSSDKDGNWKMVWFKPLLDYVRQLEDRALRMPQQTYPTPSDMDIAREIAECFSDQTGHLEEVSAILTRYREQAVAPLREDLEIWKRLAIGLAKVHEPYVPLFPNDEIRRRTVSGALLDEVYEMERKSLAAHQPKKDNHDG